MTFWARVFDPKNKLYEGLETVLHAAAVSAIKSCCESIVESSVSKYEYHANSRRNLNEDAVSDEFLIAQNGPVISKCDKVLEGALTGLYGDKKNWHFVRRTGTFPKDSLVIQRLKKETSHLAFMDE